jgi:sugar (pentulose or hexulose) kinase
MDAWVGLDVGTTASKAVVYDGSGAPVAEGRAPTVWDPAPEGAQIPAGRLLDGALAALTAAADLLPAALRIAGVGITSMGETGVLVDAAGYPVAPAVAWHDDRDGREVDELRRDIGDDTFAGRTGKPLRGRYALTKHRWLTRHEPGAAEAVRRFNVAEWVALGLGAQEACDRALACRTGWFDIASGTWWDEALAWSGASADLMPALVDAGTPLGTVVAGRAHPRLVGAVVTTAGHDHQAAALGAGAVRADDELDSCGTAEAIVRTVRPGLDPHQVLTLARAGVTTDLSIQGGRWSLLGGTEGGLAMQRTLHLLGVGRDGLADLDRRALEMSAPRVDVGGIGTHGLVLQTAGDDVGPAEVWRAVVEAATAGAARLHTAMTSAVGPHHRLIVTGGWSRSAMVLDARRRALGELTVSGVAEPGTLGAASMAARAAGALGPDDVLGCAP